MPTSSVGRASSRGVTLLEMVVVLAIAGLIVGITFPAATSGIDSVRLATATDDVASFLNSAVNRVERRQQPMEVAISTREGTLSLYADDPKSNRELKMPDGITIEAVLPALQEPDDGPRRILLLPGDAVPGIGVQLANRHGTHRIVRLDPMTGFPRVESVIPK